MNATLVSLEEYLNTSYSPDREYVDGAVVERNLGEFPHSTVQSNFVHFLRQRYPHLRVLPEQRVRTTAKRTRVPDVIVTQEKPAAGVFETPPFICIEILSACDAVSDLFERLDEYAAMGVLNIWVADPGRRKAYAYRNAGLLEVDRFETEQPRILLPLDEVFHDL
jgi:Uma2 family endonuclease